MKAVCEIQLDEEARLAHSLGKSYADLILARTGGLEAREALGSLGKLRRGAHLDHPKVSHTRGRSVLATSEEGVLAEMDGELVGTLPMRATLLRGFLPVRVLAA